LATRQLLVRRQGLDNEHAALMTNLVRFAACADGTQVIEPPASSNPPAK
jgi:hypothetical protein